MGRDEWDSEVSEVSWKEIALPNLSDWGPAKVKFNYCQCDVTLPIEQHIPPEPGGAIHKSLLIVIIARENTGYSRDVGFLDLIGWNESSYYHHML